MEWGDTMSYLPFQYAYMGSYEFIEETLAMVQRLKITLEHFGQFWAILVIFLNPRQKCPMKDTMDPENKVLKVLAKRTFKRG